MATEAPKIRERFYDDGQLLSRSSFLDGRLHRTDGPAQKYWDAQGRPTCRTFYVNGELHNVGGPAMEWWDNERGWHGRRFYVNGKMHNENGPAFEKWNRDGLRQFCEFWVNGEWMSEEDFRTWQERQQRQRELAALVFALENKFPAEAPEREFLRHILPAHVAGEAAPCELNDKNQN